MDESRWPDDHEGEENGWQVDREQGCVLPRQEQDTEALSLEMSMTVDLHDEFAGEPQDQ